MLGCQTDEKKRILWINEQQDEPPAVYLSRVLALGAQKGIPMACRRGGGSDLGLYGAVVKASQTTKWVLAASQILHSAANPAKLGGYPACDTAKKLAW